MGLKGLKGNSKAPKPLQLKLFFYLSLPSSLPSSFEKAGSLRGFSSPLKALSQAPLSKAWKDPFEAPFENLLKSALKSSQAPLQPLLKPSFKAPLRSPPSQVPLQAPSQTFKCSSPPPPPGLLLTFLKFNFEKPPFSSPPS